MSKIIFVLFSVLAFSQAGAQSKPDWQAGLISYMKAAGYSLPEAHLEDPRAVELGPGLKPLANDLLHVDHNYNDYEPYLRNLRLNPSLIKNPVAAKAENLPLADSSVDAIFARYFPIHLHTTYTENKVVAEAFRVLRPGGAMFILFEKGDEQFSEKSAVPDVANDYLTYHAVKLGFTAEYVQPGRLVLPYAPKLVGFAFVKTDCNGLLK